VHFLKVEVVHWKWLVDDNGIVRHLWGAGTPLWTVSGLETLPDPLEILEGNTNAGFSIPSSLRE